MNQSQFQQAAGVSAGLATRWFPHIDAAMKEFGIVKPEDQAMFIAQSGHESAGFSALVESFNYTPAALLTTFGRRITNYQAYMLGRDKEKGHVANQPAIANLVYSNRLGNKASGDVNRPGFPGECFICELRLPDHRFRWKHNKLFLLLPEEYGPAFPAIVDCYTSPPT